MPIPFFHSTHNTPQIANPRARNNRLAHPPVTDLWIHPEKYRFYEGTENRSGEKSKHYPSLDILA